MRQLCYKSNIEKIANNVYSMTGSSTISLYYGLRLRPLRAIDSFNRLGLDTPILMRQPLILHEKEDTTSTSVNTHPKDPGHESHIDLNTWVPGIPNSNLYNRRLNRLGRDL